MDPVTRRSFLVKGSAAAVGVSAVAAGGFAVSKAGAENEPALSTDELEGAGDGPVLLQVTDPRAGTVEVFVGEQEYAFTDRALVAKVLRATR